MKSGRRLLATMLGMVLISTGTYLALGRLATKQASRPAPTAVTPMFALSGTVYLVQHGAIYMLSKGTVARMNLSPDTAWSHPAVTTDGKQLVVTAGDTRFTDLYLLSPSGVVGRRLTDDSAREVNQNHWAFYPRFSRDGSTVFYSWDPKVEGHLSDDLAVYSIRVDDGEAPPGRRWTVPDEFTGGDTGPQPIEGGGVLYAGYSVSPNEKIQSRIWYQVGPGLAAKPLTELPANCGRPALSPAEDQLAMICSPTPETANLVVAPFKDGVIGTPTLTIDDQVAAAPTWSPDGKGIAYLASGKTGNGFDLWWVPLTVPTAATPTPTPPAQSGRHQVTTGLDLDATSAPAWSPL